MVGLFPRQLENRILCRKRYKQIKFLSGRTGLIFTRAKTEWTADDNPNCSLRSFLTHDEASGWRRGVTNSVLVGRALLASGWAFHGLA